ncbi:dihydroxyacetone kinase phosphoryl donor subunit DhaM [Lactococcus sp.]|uniref:dihydroxyacetone kinase phosphoryl donor subunit DhaM n=1 Tax=Lactococcus sp. TaxID=44273 RepID=UPI0035AF1243
MLGIVIVSHSADVVKGIKKLLQEVAPHVSITTAGGLEDEAIGTSFDKIMEAVETNEAEQLLTFFDLGSARMNLEMVSEMTEKEMKIYTVPILEGSYTAAALLEVDAPLTAIEEQLEKIKIEK